MINSSWRHVCFVRHIPSSFISPFSGHTQFPEASIVAWGSKQCWHLLYSILHCAQPGTKQKLQMPFVFGFKVRELQTHFPFSNLALQSWHSSQTSSELAEHLSQPRTWHFVHIPLLSNFIPAGHLHSPAMRVAWESAHLQQVLSLQHDSQPGSVQIAQFPSWSGFCKGKWQMHFPSTRVVWLLD